MDAQGASLARSSRILLPIRSNLAFFETSAPRTPLEARVKEAALLFEELDFEAGCYEVTAGVDGTGFDVWRPPHHIRDLDELRRLRASITGGAPYGVWLGEEVEPGVAADPQHAMQVAGGSIQTGFVAEFHTLLADTGLDDQPWVTLGLPPPDVYQAALEFAQERHRPFDKIEPPLTENPWIDTRVKFGLDFDMAQSALLRLPIQIDELRMPLLRREATVSATDPEEAHGAEPLSILAPDFSKLPWPEIIALHDHDAIGNFRSKLQEIAGIVASLPQTERSAAIASIGVAEAVKKISDLTPSGRERLLDLVGGATFDLLPYGGTLYSGIKELAEYLSERDDWWAILLRLHSH